MDTLLRGLWLKEWLLNGQAHADTNPQQAANPAKIGQTHLTEDKIRRFLQSLAE